MFLAVSLLIVGAAMFGLVVELGKKLFKWRVQSTIRNLPESMKEGSALVTVALQQFPYVVGIFSVKKKRPDTREFKGTGFILEGHILTANHVIDQVKPALQDKENLYDLYARTFDGQFHRLGDWVQLHTDAVAFVAPQGYKSAKVETLSRPQHAQVVAARDSSNSSMGIIMNKPDIAYGFVEYQGSTISGFSGAPYTNGQKVLGMHLQGGTGGNFGYSASFLISKLRKMAKPESSEWAAFERALAQAAQDAVEWDRGLDETEVRVGGRYFLFDNEEFDEYVEESEFMDWFYDVDEDNKRHRFKKSIKVRKNEHLLEEPDFEGGDNSFLEVTAQPVSSGQDLKKDIDSLQSNMRLIQSMLTSIQKDMVGLQERCESWNEVSSCMQKFDQELKELRVTQLPRSLNMLEQNLTDVIRSNLGNLQTLTTQTGTSVSEQPSERWTQPVVPVSEPSQNIQPSDKRWDGMESDFEKFKTWRSSVDLSDPEYVLLRNGFLTSLGLATWQSKILITRMKNILAKKKGRKQMKELRTGSNSS